MKLSIKSLHLQDFKGVKDETYVFDNADALIEGKNGSGKSTIANSWFWLLADRDITLHGNPDIRPIGVEECTPRVEAVIDVDGKEITLAKQQKRTVSKPNADGISKIALTNSYEINSVPKTERDFNLYLSDLGINLDLFLPLSHSEVFTSQKTADMRKVLFGMTSEISDFDIANSMDNVSELRTLLADYKLEEVVAMQNATIRKIKEDYGKSGEILRAKIEGLESAKVELDLSALGLAKADADRRLAEANSEKAKEAEKVNHQNEISQKIMEIKFEQGDFLRKTTAAITDKAHDLKSKLLVVKSKIANLENGKKTYETRIENYELLVSDAEHDIAKLTDTLNASQNAQFDEKSTICPTCGQFFPLGKIAEIKAEFEKSKEIKAKMYTTDINAKKERITVTQSQISQLKAVIQETNLQISDALAEVDKINKEISLAEREEASITDSEQYKAYNAQIKALEEEYASIKAVSTLEIDSKIAMIREEIRKIDMEYGKVESNNEIDIRIEELRNKQMLYEQNKANAEMILYQVDLLSKRKNELLSEQINSYFNLVKWVLFRYAKNGNYEDCCIATIDGKELGVSTNNALAIRAKVDICEGLQRFYKQNYPIMLDNIEALDSKSREALVTDSQLLMFAVTDTALAVKEA